jgi:L-alanine-DL-glutamate epimerase-like enolase superfamily enzyme
MKIDSVDFFYLSMPVVRDVGDGSQDALLVRIESGGLVGWGECEAAPLVCLAAWCCPMSHSACKPVSASVLRQRLDSPADIARINALVRANSFDLLQTDHTLSGIDVALWDLVGKRLQEPVYRLLGYDRAFPKVAYASQLFGDDPAATFRAARQVAATGFQAAKFGWGPYGRGSVDLDAEHVRAAREGLGPGRQLLVDAGTIWGDDVAPAAKRVAALAECGVVWLEEPFVSGALRAYSALATQCAPLRLAGGEGCHDFHQARNMIDYAGIGFVQIDAGRVGGLTTAKQVADYAQARGVQYVNHTFTSSLALSASLQPYAGLESHNLCEFPCAPSLLAQELTTTRLLPDKDGHIEIPERPGLGLEINPSALRKYHVPVEIRAGGKTLFTSTGVLE